MYSFFSFTCFTEICCFQRYAFSFPTNLLSEVIDSILNAHTLGQFSLLCHVMTYFKGLDVNPHCGIFFPTSHFLFNAVLRCIAWVPLRVPFFLPPVNPTETHESSCDLKPWVIPTGEITPLTPLHRSSTEVVVSSCGRNSVGRVQPCQG